MHGYVFSYVLWGSRQIIWETGWKRMVMDEREDTIHFPPSYSWALWSATFWRLHSHDTIKAWCWKLDFYYMRCPPHERGLDSHLVYPLLSVISRMNTQTIIIGCKNKLVNEKNQENMRIINQFMKKDGVRWAITWYKMTVYANWNPHQCYYAVTSEALLVIWFSLLLGPREEIA